MINYSDIKNIVIYQDPVLGNVTLDDFLCVLESFLQDNVKFEQVVYNILNKNKFNNKIATQIMNLSSTDYIQLYIDIIKNKI